MIPFKSKLSRYKNIYSRNRAFNTLSDEDKRKEIAYDCLTLVIDSKIEGNNSVLYWSQSLLNITLQIDPFVKINNHLPNCKVCARGGIMLSSLRLGNGIEDKLNKIHSGNKDIVKEFNKESLEDIESEYECSRLPPYKVNTNEKLANIMLNIINNGDFVIGDRTDYLKLYNININNIGD